MADIVETARAKINLALHVVGRRTDGFHLIESLVTFADIGDRLLFSAAPADRLTASGSFAAGLPGEADNLVAQARDMLRDATPGHPTPPVAIHLEKNLPIASGIGGGSAGAAACLRGLMRFWDLADADIDLTRIAAELGADVPMCLISRPLFASGVGERTQCIETMPAMALVLANPGVAVSTPEVFAGLSERNNPPIALDDIDRPRHWTEALKALRNDLQASAEAIAPSVVTVCRVLAGTDAVLTRMSGSGATCFALYDSLERAQKAADTVRSAHPAWYVCATTTRSGTSREPQP